MSVRFKIGLKRQVWKNSSTLKNRILQFPAQRHFYCLNCKLLGIEPGSKAEFPSTWTNKPNTQEKDCYLYMFMNPFRSAEWWTCIFQWSKFHFPIFLLSKPRVWVSIHLFQYTNVYLCAKVRHLWWSKANDWRKATSSNMDLFLSKAQKQHSTRKLQFSFDQMFHKRLSIIMINRLCREKLETSSYASGIRWGLTKPKFIKSQFLERFGSHSCFL